MATFLILLGFIHFDEILFSDLDFSMLKQPKPLYNHTLTFLLPFPLVHISPYMKIHSPLLIIINSSPS